jgi:hypothetical protein
MKNTLLLSILISFTGNCFAKTYYIYTASANGSWASPATWTMIARTDNISKDKFIIPSSYTVLADDNVNTLGYTDVEIQISGTLQLGLPTTLSFGSGSKIEVFSTGSIEGNGARQTINIGSVTKYEGNKNKVLRGPVYADISTGSAPTGFAAFSSLAVHFISFTVSAINDHSVELKWSTANEKNNSQFVIERQVNGNQWTAVATVPAASGSEALKQYSYADKAATGSQLAYRLKQIDIDGKYEYSTVAVIKRNQENDAVNIYAFDKSVTMQVSNNRVQKLDVQVININGRILCKASFSKPSGKIILNLGALPTGNYVIIASGNDQVNAVRKVFIN